MLRLFVALPLPEYARDYLAGVAQGIPGARWVSSDRYHLTMRFIGEVDGSVARDVCDALERIDLPEIDLQLHGLGTFSDAKRNGPAQRGAAAVLWAGVRQNEGLNRLRTKIENAVQRIGLEADRRKWHPHITLARLHGQDQKLLQYLNLRGDYLGEPFRIREFNLYSSFLGHGSGALYREEASFPLGDKMRAEPHWMAAAGAEEY